MCQATDLMPSKKKGKFKKSKFRNLLERLERFEDYTISTLYGGRNSTIYE